MEHIEQEVKDATQQKSQDTFNFKYKVFQNFKEQIMLGNKNSFLSILTHFMSLSLSQH